jgi:DNA-directed RNA polymerase subunit K/omega
VETGDLRSKPLAIALEEIADGKVNHERLEAPGIK